MSIASVGRWPRGSTVFGRPFKPQALGLIGASSVLISNEIHYLNGMAALPEPSWWGFLFAVGSILSMTLGWVARSQHWYEFGLLWAMGAWVASGIELVLMGRSVTWVLLFFSIALMAGGAYWLERLDDGDS